MIRQRRRQALQVVRHCDEESRLARYSVELDGWVVHIDGMRFVVSQGALNDLNQRIDEEAEFGSRLHSRRGRTKRRP